ncbi:MAG: aminotransferase class III-fold pyridoxal phosphate-dependent enzyme [Faecalibacterium prausnitzii]
MATLTATGQERVPQLLRPLQRGLPVRSGRRYRSPDRSWWTAHTCAVMLELIQGEGGVMALDPDYVQAVRKLCDEKDLVLIVDEVQTGVGRTGTFLCCEHYNLKPDVVTLAKGLGGGLPIGAVLMNEKVAEGMGPGTHGSTFGGNPVVCAGANVVVDRMDQSFLANVNERAVQLRAGIAKLPHVKSISGIGLMVGIEFYDGIKAADVLAACREAGLLVLTAKTRLRLLPPLTLSEHDVEMALEILGERAGARWSRRLRRSRHETSAENERPLP